MKRLCSVIIGGLVCVNLSVFAADFRVVSVGTMVRVPPTAKDLSAKAESVATLWAARGEHEAAQLVVIAGDKPLAGVKVICPDLRQENGSAVISTGNITCYVVNFIPNNPARKIPPELDHVLVDGRSL